MCIVTIFYAPCTTQAEFVNAGYMQAVASLNGSVFLESAPNHLLLHSPSSSPVVLACLTLDLAKGVSF